MRTLGKTHGVNLHPDKLGFTLVSTDNDCELWHKKSVKQVGVLIQIWRRESNVCVYIINKAGECDNRAIGYYCDTQSQLRFLLVNNLQVASHLFRGAVGSVFKQNPNRIIQSASISHDRILPDGSSEKMIEWESGKGEVYRHTEYDSWKKECDLKMKALDRQRTSELKEWLKTPPEWVVGVK